MDYLLFDSWQNIDGTQFIFIKTHNLYFVCTTKFNVSPALVIDLLNRLATVFKDYCGVLSEESLRFNFGLIYEILDESLVFPSFHLHLLLHLLLLLFFFSSFLCSVTVSLPFSIFQDFGYPQLTSSDALKTFIYDKPAVLKDSQEKLITQLNAVRILKQNLSMISLSPFLFDLIVWKGHAAKQCRQQAHLSGFCGKSLIQERGVCRPAGAAHGSFQLERATFFYFIFLCYFADEGHIFHERLGLFSNCRANC
jgi:hypothetical protein